MEILGLLDTLESMILDGFKIPLSKKTLVNEEDLLNVIDKIRLVVEGGGDFAKKAISGGASYQAVAEKQKVLKEIVGEKQPQNIEDKAVEVLQNAYQLAKEVRSGADDYADEVLANLEATSQRILRTIRAGRERLSKYHGNENKEIEPAVETAPAKKSIKEDIQQIKEKQKK